MFTFGTKKGMLRYTLFCCLLLVSELAMSQSIAIKDSYGRTLILHGLNTSRIHEKDVERENHDFGWNAVRYLIFWGAIEPKKDSFDEVYLANVKERVEWYTNRGMYVILDMHQDVYGYGVGDNGAPEWASTHTRIQNLIPDKWPWWMQNLEPKVVQSYVQFFKYKKRKELQQHYIRSWLKVVALLKGNDHVIGYDLMNEPHGGKIVKTLAGGFERKWLDAMYKRLIPAIRREDTSRYIFFEPRSFGVNFGMRSALPQVHDTIVNKLVYAPHCYMKFVDVGGDYKQKDKRSLKKWFRYRDREGALHHTGMLLGEFGLSPGKKDFDRYLQDILKGVDDRMASWTYWSGDPGGWGPLKGDLTPSPIMGQLLRIYPSAVAGDLNSFSFDASAQSFEMEYISDTSIKVPTIISVPLFTMKDNYHWDVTGADHFTAKRNPMNNSLEVIVADDHTKVRVKIFP
jgi:endoglycosylceramidase